MPQNLKSAVIKVPVRRFGGLVKLRRYFVKIGRRTLVGKGYIEFARHRLVFGKVVYKLRLLVYKGTERLVFLPVVTLLKPVTVCVYIRAAGLYNKLKTVRRYFEIPGHTVNNIRLLGLGFKIEISGQYLKQLYISPVSRNNNPLPYIRDRYKRLRAVWVPAAVYGDRLLFSRYQFLDIHFVPL